jgi:hypothetical protein
MDDPGQQTRSHGPVDQEVNPNQHKGKSRTLAIVSLVVICLSGFLMIFFMY